MPTWRVGDWCCCGGTVYAHVMLLLWGASTSCGMGVMRQNDGNWQCLIQRNRVQWTRFLRLETSLLRKRVLWTRFLPTFFVREQLSSCRNRALFTRIARNQNSLKRFLTNDIVWVLLLFSKKTKYRVKLKRRNFRAQSWWFRWGRRWRGGMGSSTMAVRIWLVVVSAMGWSCGSGFFFFFWNLYSLFLSSNGLVCGNCKDLVRHTWSVAHSGLYRWLGRRVDQSG